MEDKKKENLTKDELLEEYYAQVEGGDSDTHTHVDYHDSYGDSCCC